jgi:hypothetical protein
MAAAPKKAAPEYQARRVELSGDESPTMKNAPVHRFRLTL